MSIDDRSPRGVPSSRTTPQRGRRTLASAISSVDLPDPLGPTNAVTVPLSTAKSRCSEITRLR